MLSVLCAVALASTSSGPSIAEAAARARKQIPSAAWSAKRALVADFTYDGTLDVALLGIADGSVTVAVVEGPVSTGSRVVSLRFPRSGICGRPDQARIELEQPGIAGEECPVGDRECEALARRLRAASRKGGKGIALGSEVECDRFHIVYDRGRLWWSRL